MKASRRNGNGKGKRPDKAVKKSKKVKMYQLTITEEEKSAVAAVLSQPSTVAPVQMAPFLTSFIAKFNTAPLMMVHNDQPEPPKLPETDEAKPPER